jgi:hypothetical protein
MKQGVFRGIGDQRTKRARRYRCRIFIPCRIGIFVRIYWNVNAAIRVHGTVRVRENIGFDLQKRGT